MRGDVDGAAGLVQKTLDSKLGDKDPDAARAHFLMARIETHEGLMDDAQIELPADHRALEGSAHHRVVAHLSRPHL